MKALRADTILLLLVAALVLGGALIFTSAALGLLARGATHISSVVFNHFCLGIGGGTLLMLSAYAIDYRRFRPFAPYIFGTAVIATALVFIPGLGFEHGGGRRWIDLGLVTIQPAEFLKIAAIIAGAALFTTLREETASWRGLAAFLGLLAIPAILLILQPDVGALGIITATVFAMFIAAGARIRDIGLILFGGVAIIALLAMTPQYRYVYDRIETFVNPAEQSALVEGYQIRQSLIAVGSGGFAGRGFGQGVQKFTYLPEPMGDSIFAVLAEEMGFIGAVTCIMLFLLLGIKGYSVAAHAPDLYGGLLAVGISTFLVGGAFINIAAMVGIIPLTGDPLPFISQGGSAMLISLTSAGILLNISRKKK